MLIFEVENQTFMAFIYKTNFTVQIDIITYIACFYAKNTYFVKYPKICILIDYRFKTNKK